MHAEHIVEGFDPSTKRGKEVKDTLVSMEDLLHRAISLDPTDVDSHFQVNLTRPLVSTPLNSCVSYVGYAAWNGAALAIIRFVAGGRTALPRSGPASNR